MKHGAEDYNTLSLSQQVGDVQLICAIHSTLLGRHCSFISMAECEEFELNKCENILILGTVDLPHRT